MAVGTARNWKSQDRAFREALESATATARQAEHKRIQEEGRARLDALLPQALEILVARGFHSDDDATAVRSVFKVIDKVLPDEPAGIQVGGSVVFRFVSDDPDKPAIGNPYR